MWIIMKNVPDLLLLLLLFSFIKWYFGSLLLKKKKSLFLIILSLLFSLYPSWVKVTWPSMCYLWLEGAIFYPRNCLYILASDLWKSRSLGASSGPIFLFCMHVLFLSFNFFNWMFLSFINQPIPFMEHEYMMLCYLLIKSVTQFSYGLSAHRQIF